MGGMSRLRRWVVSDRWFFVTRRLLPRRESASLRAYGANLWSAVRRGKGVQ